jgi:cytochrome c oxidase subunit 3
MPDAASSPEVAEQFVAPDQQRLADRLGMWVFLGTEVMLFGGLFMAIVVYRLLYASQIKEASTHLHLWLAGGNTAILLTSSLFMAGAVTAARVGLYRHVLPALSITIALGIAFLVVKGVEYALEYGEGLIPHVGPSSPVAAPAGKLFLNLYFIGTGLHAVHLTIGIAMLSLLSIRIARRRLNPVRRHMVIEASGLYWHFVDVVWVFLYPAFYLIGR